jgi:hypothetical protein
MPGTARSLYDFERFDASGDPLVELKKYIQRKEAGLSPTFVSGQFAIPAFDTQDFTYYGATNNVKTITYSKDGSPVATLTFTYVGSGAADDDDVLKIIQS